MATEKKYKWHKLAKPDEFLVAEGVVMHLAVPEKHFCITQHKGEYFAFQAKCRCRSKDLRTPQAGPHWHASGELCFRLVVDPRLPHVRLSG